MPTLIEHIDSREGTFATTNEAFIDLIYKIWDTEDDAVVDALVLATAPATYGGLFQKNFHKKHIGAGNWDISVRYSPIEPKEAGQSKFSFDTGGGTTKLTQSLETIRGYGLDDEGASESFDDLEDPFNLFIPNFKGAIGVSKDRVEGTEVTSPVYHFQETHFFAAASITNAYKGALFSLTGAVNNASFKGFATGEVLFLGASGSQEGAEPWEITFKFAASPNIAAGDDVFVGDIGPIVKKGWEYLWIRYADDVSNDNQVKVPVNCYVEQVYKLKDFSNLGIGT